MPICITGMHRSGTSMVARLLHLCGLYLGQDDDLIPPKPANPDGFWENVKFVDLNDAILSELGGGWDYPPSMPNGWNEEERFLRLKAKAEITLQEFFNHEPWGWKDPRNSLTLPFWMSFIPQMKVVICLRNPLEVALSLRRRNFLSYPLSLTLWKTYNQRVFGTTLPEHRIITHYDAYFPNPRSEVRRVLDFLNLPSSERDLERCCSAVKADLRHSRLTTQHLLDADVSPDVFNLYTQMCVEAGWLDGGVVHHARVVNVSGSTIGRSLHEGDSKGAPEPLGERHEGAAVGRGQGRRQLDKSVEEAELLHRELKALRSELAGRDATIRELQAQLEERTAWAQRAAEEIAQRDATIRELQAALEEKAAARCEPTAARRHGSENPVSSSHGQATTAPSDSPDDKGAPPSQAVLDKLRPVVPEIIAGRNYDWDTACQKILILGVYLADQLNNVEDIVSTLSETTKYEVTQRWVGLGGEPPTKRVADVTISTVHQRVPKFQIINEVLAKEDLTPYEYVLIIDDDIVLPHDFVDHFISLQAELEFSIAQPARTSTSSIDIPIVEQQRGVLARQTLFVEPGPAASFHKSVFKLIFPFDLTSPMGWGYGNVWAYLLSQRKMKMGIIDVVPVDHSLRMPLVNYSGYCSDQERTELFRKHKYLAYEQCFRVLNAINLEDGELRRQAVGRDITPLISVIIPTYNKAALLQASLESLIDQSIPPHQYEVIVVDDGSMDATPDICGQFSSKLPLTYLRLDHSGISAAKNLGIFASTGSLLLFLNDDHIAAKDLLEEHLKTHEKYSQENVAVLGYTTWTPSLLVTPAMDHLAHIGQFLFSYDNLEDGQVLDFTYFRGGCISCKRWFLVKRGIFRQQLQFRLEDLELGYRLSKLDLKVIFNRNAVHYINRPVTYDEFCLRGERQGMSQVLLNRLHSDPTIQQYCQVSDAEESWQGIKQTLEDKVCRVYEIESLLTSLSKSEEKNMLLEELRSLYGWTFHAFKIKGIVEAMRS
jgi:GT2 family glycosyltransferase